ncbi:hypothetical protein ACHAW6_002476 [Cyclotella cf. meneghiniana]
MAPTLFGHHSQVAAFASVTKHHSSLKRVCNTITSCSRYDNIRTPPAIYITASRSLHLHAQSPLSIIGGATATVVANTDTVSTAAITTMILLALQYCAQPPLTRKFLDSKANKKGITMIEEIVKMGLSAILFLRCGKDVVSTELHGWTLSSSLLLAGIPAVLYAVQGVLTYLGYQNTDSVTFNGLNQTKTLSAALWCFLLMGKSQSVVQIVALAILLFSALLFQGSISFSDLFRKRSDETRIIHTDAHDVEKARPHTSFSKGIMPCLGAAFISGLAGALSQKGVQLAGGKGRNAYLYTMELGVYSSISLLISLFATKNGRESLSGEGGIFKHWTPFSIIPITVRALGGILTALVHKYAGATRKGFALIMGLIMTGVMQSVIERERLSFDEIMAMVLVILSSYLHLAYPPTANIAL